MNSNDCPAPHPAVILRDSFDDYSLLFQPLFGDVIGLHPVSLAVWRALDGRRTLVEAAVEVQRQCEDAPPDVAADVGAFVAELVRRGFVCTARERDLFLSQTANTGDTPGAAHSQGEDRTGTDNSFPAYASSLAGGSRLALQAGDAGAASVVAQFADLAQLQLIRAADTDARRLLVLSEGRPAPGGKESAAVCILQRPERQTRGPGGEEVGRAGSTIKQPNAAERRVQQLWRLSAFIGYETAPRGGALLHGALAVHGPSDQGVLLVGRSGVGKTTASRRLPPPWVSRSDDAALVVRDAGGSYWAHPWPTWSQLLNDGIVESRDLQNAAPLKAIFILEQAAQDGVALAGGGAAVSMLVEIARQANWRLWLGNDRAALMAAQVQRFDNLCALVQAVPVYLLDVSLEGEFWKEIEKAMRIDLVR